MRRRFAASPSFSTAPTLLLPLLLLILAAHPAATQEISARSLELELGGRLQTQVIHSSVSGGPGVDAVLRRAWLTLDGELNRHVDGRLQADLEGGLKDAYVRFTLDPSFRVSMGKFKRAFDLFELQSSSRINVERDGRVPGVDDCEGVGGVCSLSRLTQSLGYSDRDVGVSVAGDIGERLAYLATVTNGVGGEGDENDAKSAAARLTFGLSDRVTLGGNVSTHDYMATAGSAEHAAAWGVDLELGAFATPGLHLQTGLVGGDNWKNPVVGGDPSTFVAAQGIASWYSPTGSDGPIVAVEPVVRTSWADPDTDAEDDGGLLFTPGLWIHFGDRNKIGATTDVYSREIGGTEWSFKLQSNLFF